MNDQFRNLLGVFRDAHYDVPDNLPTAVRALPEPGALPSPWATCTLIAASRYDARVRWAKDIIARLPDPAETARDTWPAVSSREWRRVPGLPGWWYHLSHRSWGLRHPATGEQILRYLESPPDGYGAEELAGYWSPLEHRDPAATRLVDLHAHECRLGVSIDELVDGGLLHEVRDPIHGPLFALCDALGDHVAPIAAFAEAWSDPTRRLWLGALAGDWPAAYREAEAVGDRDLLDLTRRRADACLTARVAHLRARIAREGYTRHLVPALADAGGPEFRRWVRRELRRLDTRRSGVLWLIAEDPSFVDEVARLHRRRQRCVLQYPWWSDSARYLARHSPDSRAKILELAAEGGCPGQAAIIAVECAPDLAPSLLRRALRAADSLERRIAAELLGELDCPWGRRELMAALRESADPCEDGLCRALRHSRDTATRRAAGSEWEAGHPDLKGSLGDEHVLYCGDGSRRAAARVIDRLREILSADPGGQPVAPDVVASAAPPPAGS